MNENNDVRQPIFPGGPLGLVLASIVGVHVEANVSYVRNGHVELKAIPSYSVENRAPFFFEIKDAMCILPVMITKMETAFDVPISPVPMQLGGISQQDPMVLSIPRATQGEGEFTSEFKKALSEIIRSFFHDMVEYDIRIKLPIGEGEWNHRTVPLELNRNFTVTINDVRKE